MGRIKRIMAASTMLVGTMAIGAGANHIIVAGPLWYPTGPGTNQVNFIHTEVESTQCCAGSPTYDFGDDTGAFFAVTLNQDTPPGIYNGYLYRRSTFEFLGVFPAEVQHVGAPPADVGSVPNTVMTFSHIYPAAGPYVVTWTDCCLGSPQIPYRAPDETPDEAREPLDTLFAALYDAVGRDAQQSIDEQWSDEVVPAFETTVQAVSPFGVSGGTAFVIAL